MTISPEHWISAFLIKLSESQAQLGRELHGSVELRWNQGAHLLVVGNEIRPYPMGSFVPRVTFVVGGNPGKSGGEIAYELEGDQAYGRALLSQITLAVKPKCFGSPHELRSSIQGQSK